MKERVDLASQLIENKFLSLNYIYSNIFNLTDDQAEFEKNEVLEDIKHKFRQSQIESEGNDPAITKESFGTPHDIAVMHTTSGGSKSYQINDNEVPDGGWPGAGRPAKNLSYSTDDSPFGRDPIGKKDVANTLKVNQSVKHKYKNASPLASENKKMTKDMERLINNMSGIKVKTKQIISESLKSTKITEENEPNLLNEDNLLDEL